MDLRAALVRVAARRPHVLLVPAIGGAEARLAAEAELAQRCWPQAASPADADVLVVAGPAGPRLAEIVEAVWAQVPLPRIRVQINEPHAAAAALDRAAADLAEQCATAAGAGAGAGARRLPPHSGAGHPDHTDPHHGHPTGHQAAADHGAEHPTLDHGATDRKPEPPAHAGRHDDEHAEPQTGGHTGHHGNTTGDTHGGHRHGHDMPLPGGLRMAHLGEDRDGLMLDQLHLPLGPVLPDWPAGLVLHVVLQGDVVQHAEAELLDVDAGEASTDGSFWDVPCPPAADSGSMTRGEQARRRVAADLDSLGRLLAVAGWADPAARARRLRDELLAGADVAESRGRARALLAQIRRSRTLRWLVRGINTGGVDVNGRLTARLDTLEAAFADLGSNDPTALEPRLPDERINSQPRGTVRELDELASLLVGAEFAAARLIVAALDPDTDAITVAVRRARHG